MPDRDRIDLAAIIKMFCFLFNIFIYSLQIECIVMEQIWASESPAFF